MDECISRLRKECSLDLDPNTDTLPSEGLSEDWTMFQNAFRLIQICGKLLPCLLIEKLVIANKTKLCCNYKLKAELLSLKLPQPLNTTSSPVPRNGALCTALEGSACNLYLSTMHNKMLHSY